MVFYFTSFHGKAAPPQVQKRGKCVLGGGICICKRATSKVKRAPRVLGRAELLWGVSGGST